MADHSAIVALAKDQFERATGGGGSDWDRLAPSVQEHWCLMARSAYAAVLRDLMEPSDKALWVGSAEIEVQMKMLNASDYRDEAAGIHKAMLRARAREIGVEI